MWDEVLTIIGVVLWPLIAIIGMNVAFISWLGSDMKEFEGKIEWLNKHADTMIVLGGILSSVLWMNGKFTGIEKDIAVVKTVLIIKNIMPVELAQKE
jgi:hypothetical protein